MLITNTFEAVICFPNPLPLFAMHWHFFFLNMVAFINNSDDDSVYLRRINEVVNVLGYLDAIGLNNECRWLCFVCMTVSSC